MLGHYAISSAPLSGLGLAVTLKLGASSVSASATTSNVASKTVFTASSNSVHLTTNQIPKRLREGVSANSANVSTVTLANRKGVSSVLSQGSATNTANVQKLAVTSSANSATATQYVQPKRLREATSQNSGNVITNTVAAGYSLGLILASSSASLDTIYLRRREISIGLSSSVNLDIISDILWETLDSEMGVATNLTFTELTPASSSVSWNDLGNP